MPPSLPAAEVFLASAIKSGLVEPQRLQLLVTEFTDQGGDTNDTPALAQFLIEKNLVTRWQAEKLLQGRHKGYFIGKYRLLSLLGKGGMSSVYLAEHVLMRRQCAVKVLPFHRVANSSHLARFRREAVVVAALNHPNIVRAYDVDVQSDNDAEIHFLVMEYIAGASLQELVDREGPLDFAVAAEYIRQAALGLEHAHQADVVHRDVKPGNFLVDAEGTVKLLDLGLARSFSPEEQNERALTIAHDELVLGTADYLAPEQALDSHTVDHRADLYSLGCTFYFLLTGHPPFASGTLTQRLLAHQTKNPPPVETDRPDIPSPLSAILQALMQKSPEKRPATAAAVAETLQRWLSEQSAATGKAVSAQIFDRQLNSQPQRDLTLGNADVSIDDADETRSTSDLQPEFAPSLATGPTSSIVRLARLPHFALYLATGLIGLIMLASACAYFLGWFDVPFESLAK